MFRVAEELLAVLPRDVAPKVEVGVLRAGEDAGGLEDTCRHDVQHSAGYRDFAGAAVVQHEGWAVVVSADGKGVVGCDRRPPSQIEWVADIPAKRETSPGRRDHAARFVIDMAMRH